MIFVVQDLFLNSDIYVWRENYVRHSGKSTGPNKLLAVENETCTLQLSSSLTNFRIITVKSLLQEPPNITTLASHDLDAPKSDLGPPVKEVIHSDNGNDIDATNLLRRNPACIYYLPTRFQNVADISIFLKNDDISQLPFTESRYKEINSLLEKGAFKFVTISDISIKMRIFNYCFVDEIKNEGIATAFEKSRLVIQAYNNDAQEEILTQASTI